MSDPVRVLVVSPPAPVWGAQLYLLDQVAGLRDRGIELVLASPRGTPFAELWEEHGHELADLPLELHAGLRKPGSLERQGIGSLARTGLGIGRGVRTLARAAREFDMMYSFSLRTHIEVAVAGRLARVPTALDLVDIVRPGVGRRVLRTASRLATLTVANSWATASVLPERARVQVIHPGIDLDRFARIADDDPRVAAVRAELSGATERPLIAIIGRIDVHKGVHVMVEAMKLLGGAAAEARLLVVGTSGTGPTEYADRVRAQAESLGDRVAFVGRREDVPDVIRAVDVVVVASMAEPFGLTALEAQAVGTPVVGTRAGGLVEFVEHEVSGLLVPPTDASALAAAIERVLADDELRRSIVETAHERAVPARGVAAQLDEIADMYRRVAGRSAAGSDADTTRPSRTGPSS
ncbi:MAG: glycosyltransferase family 4 protein [Actinomycetota bacterium]